MLNGCFRAFFIDKKGNERIINYQSLPSNIVEGMFVTEKYLRNSRLSKNLLNLIKFRVAQINGCAYCLDMHYKEARQAGETELRLYSLVAWQETDFFTSEECAVLAYTEAVTLISENDISQNLFDTLLKYYPEKEIADITMAIVNINGWTRISKSFKFAPGKYEVGQLN